MLFKDATVETAYFISYRDFMSSTGLQVFESPNDTDYVVDVTDAPLHEYQLSDIEKIYSYKAILPWNLSTLMQHLCNKGDIPPGKYVIQVSW